MSNNKFLLNNNSYAPGLCTYGVKGNDGSIGLTGKSIYYTSLDKNISTDYNTIKLKIKNNEILSNNLDSSLGDRVYQNGDLVLDLNGNIYEINLDSNDNILNLVGKISQNEYFYPSGISYLQKYRIINNFGIAVDYINSNNKNISDISTFINNGNINYNNINISYVEFPHINYSDVQNNNLIPFELYTTGNNNENLSLIYDTNKNGFAFISESNVILDVSDNVYINNNNAIYDYNNIGSVLTTNDIRSINLFNSQLNAVTDDIFNVTNVNTVLNVKYNLSKLFKGNVDLTNLIINLHINIIPNDYDSLDFDNFNDIVIRNLKYSNDDTNITITNLKLNQKYNVFISLIQNGWEITLPAKEIDTNYDVSPVINWRKSSETISDASGNIILEAEFTYTSGINSINDLTLIEQENGITTNVNYIDASIIEVNTDDMDASVPGTIKVSVNYNENYDPFNTTNNRTFSLLIKKTDNSLISNSINITQTGHTIKGLFDFICNTVLDDYKFTIPFVFENFIADASGNIPKYKFKYDCVIDWGDGSISSLKYDPTVDDNVPDVSLYSHRYKNIGKYNVKIGGRKIGGISSKYRSGIDISSWNICVEAINDWTTDEPINFINGLCYHNTNLTKIPNKPLNVDFNLDDGSTAIKSAADMFNLCNDLNFTSLNNILPDNILNEIEDISGMFYSNENLTLSVSDISMFMNKLKNVKYANLVFYNCKKLFNQIYDTTFKLPNLIPSSTELIDITGMYASCTNMNMEILTSGTGSLYQIMDRYKLKSANKLFSNTNIKGVINNPLFVNCYSLESTNEMLYKTKITAIKSSIWENCIGMNSCKFMCAYCTELTEVTNTLFNGTITTEISTMSLDANGNNVIIIPYGGNSSDNYPSTKDASIQHYSKGVSQIYNMYKLFYNCTKLTSIPGGLINNTPYIGRKCKLIRNVNDPSYNSSTLNTLYTGSLSNMLAYSGLLTYPMTSYGGGSRPQPIEWWNLRSVDLRFNSQFTASNSSNIPSVFYNCSNMNNYGNVPYSWKAAAVYE